MSPRKPAAAKAEDPGKAPRIWLKFEDGSELTVRQTPRSLISAERKWGSMQKAPTLEATFYVAFIAAKITGVGFEDWVNSIVDFEELSGPSKAEAASSETSASSEPASSSSTD